MTAPPSDRAATRRRLQGIAGGAGRIRTSAALLLLDTLAAIGFAGGLAGAVAAVAEGRSPAPGLALLLAAGAGRAGMAALAARVGATGAREAKAGLRARAWSAAMRRPPGASSTGRALAAVADEVEALDGYVARFLPARAAATIAPALVAAAAAFASPVSAGILLLTLIPFGVAMALAGAAAAEETRRQFEAMARLSSVFVDRIRALPLILAFQAGEGETRAIGRAADEAARRTMRVLAVAFLSSGALEFFAALSVALVAVYAGFNLLGLLPVAVPERLDLARGFFVLALAPEFYAPLRRLAAAYHDRQAAETAAERLAAMEGEGTGVEPERVDLSAPPAIAFRDVAIRYPGAERPVVEHFFLSVRAGETVALLGPSGCGKTSLLMLLLGLAPLEAGMVTIDGAPLGGRAVAAGWAGQAPLILAGTLRENIAMGRPSAGMAEIMAAALAAGLGPVLARRGLDGVVDERGGGLSGGERRRVGLARALLSDAPLLLLDEPTAHLDPASEAAMIAAIARARAGRTVLIATHSAALAAIADRVIPMDFAA